MIWNPQMALVQAGAAITQGVQAYLLQQFSVLATKAFVSCTVSRMEIICYARTQLFRH